MSNSITLSAEQLNVLTDDQKATVARMEAFFASDGWKFIQGWIEQNMELSLDRCLNASNWDAYLAARVQRSEFQRWQNLEMFFLSEFAGIADQILEEREEAVEEQYE